MWLIWVLPAIVVAGAFVAVIAGLAVLWGNAKRLRARLAALTADAERAQAIVADVSAAGQRIRER